MVNIRSGSTVSVYKKMHEYIIEEKKKNAQLNTTLNSKDKNKKNSNNDSFIKNIIDQKAQMNDILDKVNQENFKRRVQLEDEKNEAIKNVKDVCKSNKALFSKDKGYSKELDAILSGNVDEVIDSMDFAEVSKHIGNLEYGVAKGTSEEIIKKYQEALKKYYEEGADKKETFAQYMGDSNGLNIDEVMSSKSTSDEVKAHLAALECLKASYKGLYDAIDRIKTFKEESARRVKELKENMEKNIQALGKFEKI
jgi:hypothetical protein